MNGLIFTGLFTLAVFAIAVPLILRGQRKRQAIYAEVAKAHGLAYDAVGRFGNATLRGAYGGVEVLVDHEVRRTARSRAHFTRVVAIPSAGLPDGLVVTRTNLAGKIGRALGGKGIKVGRELVDRELLVEGRDPEQIVRFFHAECQGGQVSERVVSLMRQGDDARLSAAEGVAILKFGHVKSTEELSGLLTNAVSHALSLAPLRRSIAS